MARKTVHCFVVVLISLLLLSQVGNGWSDDGSITPPLRKNVFFNEVGVITGVGFGDVTEGNYIPVPLILHIGTDLKRWFPSLEKHHGQFTLYIEPQVALAFNSDLNVEAGIPFGVKYRYPFGEMISGYLLASIGPHYISLQTVDQSNGFLFADTVGTGLNFFISPGVALDIGYRFRHMSNAHTACPNGGIDTQFLMIGLSMFY